MRTGAVTMASASGDILVVLSYAATARSESTKWYKRVRVAPLREGRRWVVMLTRKDQGQVGMADLLVNGHDRPYRRVGRLR